MTLAAPDPFGCALTILVAMSAAGVAHALWMPSALAKRLAVPLDGGRSWRGRRIFGEHKTVRGFVAIVPAAAVAFALLGACRTELPPAWAAGMWALPPSSMLALGAWAGFCFMAAELPNSFWKRRLGIEPGGAAPSGALRGICLVADRLDSTLGLLLGLWLVVPVPALTWLLVLLFGPAVHLAFSALLYVSRVKARIA
jgi:hypothetical protein